MDEPTLRFDDAGLLPVVVQDARDKTVLMLAYLNQEAWEKTLSTGLCHYWSRSRGRLWLKGEESGMFQRLVEARIDCDADTVLFLVRQEGDAACHTGHRSCFYRKREGGSFVETECRVFDPESVYSKKNGET